MDLWLQIAEFWARIVMPWTRSRLKNLWPKSGIAGREWNGKEEEASRLKSTLIGAAPPDMERSLGEERIRAIALWNASGGRPGGLGKARRPKQGRPAPHSEVWASVFWQVLSRRV